MVMTVVPAAPGTEELLLSFHYVDDDKVYLFDNRIIGWAVDADEPQGTEPAPRIIGSLPPETDTDPILSPQWAVYGSNGVAYIPDVYRGRLPGLLTMLATNNGAQRQLNGDGLTQSYVINEWNTWKTQNAALTFTD
jgi:hypothetical protein